MHAVYFALAFLLCCLGVAALAAALWLYMRSLADQEIAQSISARTQYDIFRYNHHIAHVNAANAARKQAAVKAQPPPKTPGKNVSYLKPVGPADGDRKND